MLQFFSDDPYFQVRAGKAKRTVELIDGAAFADYDAKGNLLGIEMLEPCRVENVFTKIKPPEDKAKKFIRANMPQLAAWRYSAV